MVPSVSGWILGHCDLDLRFSLEIPNDVYDFRKTKGGGLLLCSLTKVCFQFFRKQTPENTVECIADQQT